VIRWRNAGVPDGARRQSPYLVVIGFGLALLAVTGVTGWQATRAVEEFGTSGVTGDTTTTVTDRRPASTADPEPGVPVTPGGLTSPTTVAPQRLRIPAVDLDAVVRPVGVDLETGELAVPDAVSTVGWYRYGPGLDADTGSIMIAGHVDSSTQGPGAFSRLAQIRPGVRVSVGGADGSVRDFTVVSREVFGKSEAPDGRLFARTGPPRLTLVTCGGTFDRRAGAYRDNIVVTVLPVG
jgi:hypothetical protein